MHIVYFLEELSKESVEVFPINVPRIQINDSSEEFIDKCLTKATSTLDIHNFVVSTTIENSRLISDVVRIWFEIFDLSIVSECYTKGLGSIPTGGTFFLKFILFFST